MKEAKSAQDRRAFILFMALISRSPGWHRFLPLATLKNKRGPQTQ